MLEDTYVPCRIPIINNTINDCEFACSAEQLSIGMRLVGPSEMKTPPKILVNIAIVKGGQTNKGLRRIHKTGQAG